MFNTVKEDDTHSRLVVDDILKVVDVSERLIGTSSPLSFSLSETNSSTEPLFVSVKVHATRSPNLSYLL